MQVRLAELQAEAAKASEVTVVSLLAELEDARAKASNLDQLSAAVRAIEAKAKVSGLLIQRTEIGGPGEFEGCRSEGETVDKLIELICNETPEAHFTAKDRAKLLEMLAHVGEFINACKAKPGSGYDPATAARSQRMIEQQRGNGRQR